MILKQKPKSSYLWAQDLVLSLLEAKAKRKWRSLPKVHYLIMSHWFLMLKLREIYHPDLYLREDPFAVALSSDEVSVMVVNHMPFLINVNTCKNFPQNIPEHQNSHVSYIPTGRWSIQTVLSWVMSFKMCFEVQSPQGILWVSCLIFLMFARE